MKNYLLIFLVFFSLNKAANTKNIVAFSHNDINGPKSMYDLSPPNISGETDAEDSSLTDSGSRETDSLALVALYNQNGGESWTNKENWLTGPLDTWENITVEDGRVTALELSKNNLTGEWCNELTNLSELRILDLSFNDISGSLSSDIEKLTNLDTLNLYQNNFSGNLPAEIGSLTNLTYLNLAYNNFSGELPNSIGNLSQLNYLYLNSNKFSGEIPQEIGNLTNLVTLNLRYNDLTGVIPETIGNLIKLETLELHYNELSGTIPVTINDLTSLEYLNLASNNFTGTFPNISNLTQLYYLSISSNNFTDIPYLSSSIASISKLYLTNNYLTFEDLEPLMDDSPTTFYYSPQNLSYKDTSIIIKAGEALTLDFLIGGSQNKYVWYCNDVKIDSTGHTLSIESADETTSGIYYCEVTNELVPNLTIRSGNFDVFVRFPANTTDSLALVALYNQNGGENWTNKENWLSGPLDTWENVTVENGRVTELHLKSNNLSGEWCSELSNLSELKVLDLFSNDLYGNLPSDINLLTKLTYLNLGNNDFSGEIPKEIGHLTNLETLNLRYNNLTGEIPETIGNLNKLETLTLSYNELSGVIPETVNNLTSLKNLHLTGNNFSGAFPNISNLSQISYLHIDNNNFSDLPNLSSSITSLFSLYLQNNYFTFEDLEPLMDEEPNIFNYSPQKLSMNDTSYILKPGDPLTLNFEIGGSQNKYVWYRDEEKIDSTGYTLTIANADETTSGIYYCEVTNELVPNLTFRSGNFEIVVRFPTNTTDSLALVALYNQNGGENWTNKENWLTGPMDTWANVTVKNGRVTELQLINNNLSGEWCSDLFNLSELKILDLSYNDISGNLPSDIDTLTNLTYLNLGYNDFSGQIPEAFGHLTNLETLNLRNNDLTGEIPKSFGNLNKLETLDLSHNDLSGIIPDAINNLTSLKYLYLTSNNFSGVFPNISNLSQITYLSLDNNNFLDIPYLSGSIASIYRLDLKNNYFTFEDLEPLMDDEPTIFYYYPQKSALNDTSLVIKSGETLTLDFMTGGSQNKYVWYRDEVKIDSTGHTLTIANADEGTSGIYYCEATSELVPKLTIRSGNFDVFVRFPANTTDSLALVALYNQNGGENWTNKENWLSGPLDTWENVTVENGRVTELQLKNNKLSGEWCSDLLNLSELQFLDLSYNDLSGNLPSDIDTLTNLTYLNLGYNDFSDQIPEAFGHLTNLETLNLRNNDLNGEIPKSIGNLNKLESLDLSYNELSGTIPDAINNLTSLKYLYLTSNNFSGVFPDISNLSQITSLYLNNNNLSDIPYLSGSVTSMYRLYLQNNYFTFEDLEPLMDDSPILFYYSPQNSSMNDTSIIIKPGDALTLDFLIGGSQNKYVWYRNDVKIDSTGHTLSIESADETTSGIYYCEVTNELAPKLTIRSGNFDVFVRFPANTTDSLALVALYNQNGGENWPNKENWLSGPLDTWENVTVENGRVTELQLINNNLSGEWCSDLLNLSMLRILNLSNNKLSGELSPEISNLSKLNSLNLSYNDFSGDIPSAIGSLSGLETLDLSSNDFSGTIPDVICNLTNLIKLDLGSNNLSGEIPENIGNLTNISVLELNSNVLSGAIPSGINNLKSVLTINLSSNQLEGAFPEIENLIQIRQLYFNNNYISDIASLINSPSTLYFLNLRNNNLDFEDLEPLMEKDFSILYYKPQNTIGGEDTTIAKIVGEKLEITLDIGGSQNQYTWYKDDALLDNPNSSLVVETAVETDAGTYYCEVTNDLVPGLTIRSRKYIVTVSPETYVPSIEEYGIRIAPNPSTGRFTLYNIQEIREIAIFNIKGEQIFFTQNSAGSEKITIHLNHKGLFILHLKTESGVILTEKIVVR